MRTGGCYKMKGWGKLTVAFIADIGGALVGSG